MKNSNHSIKEMLITVFGELFLLLGITEFLRTNVLSLVIAYIAGIIITFFYMPESDKKYTIQKDFALSPKLRKYLIKVALPPLFLRTERYLFLSDRSDNTGSVYYYRCCAEETVSGPDES